MTTKKIYEPWVKWDGGECPVPPDTRVEVKLRSGNVLGPRLAYRYRWKHIDSNSDIVEYRTVTEQPDLEAAEQLLRENGYTITPPAMPLTFEDVTPMTEAPPKGTWYWVPQPFNSRGVEAFAWGGDEYDLAALRHRMAYLKREHALIAAQHIFGLKGGRAVTAITLETIKARQDELSRTINLPAATIELRPDEQYAGLVLKDDGTPSHHLVRMAGQTTIRLSWQDAKDWASKVGGEPPTRRELPLIYAHCRAHVKPEWYWSGEAFEADTASAWSCHLGDGFQSTHLKWYENDAIAVRRIPIGDLDE